MAVVCTLLIHELDMGAYLKNGRVFCLEDQIDICYRFSRELEQLGEEIGVKIKCQHEDIFEKMHRI